MNLPHAQKNRKSNLAPMDLENLTVVSVCSWVCVGGRVFREKRWLYWLGQYRVRVRVRAWWGGDVGRRNNPTYSRISVRVDLSDFPLSQENVTAAAF